MDQIKLETVNNFTFFGSKITYDGKSTVDINCRKTEAKQLFNKKKNNLQEKRLT